MRPVPGVRARGREARREIEEHELERLLLVRERDVRVAAARRHSVRRRARSVRCFAVVAGVAADVEVAVDDAAARAFAHLRHRVVREVEHRARADRIGRRAVPGEGRVGRIEVHPRGAQLAGVREDVDVVPCLHDRQLARAGERADGAEPCLHGDRRGERTAARERRRDGPERRVLELVGVVRVPGAEVRPRLPQKPLVVVVRREHAPARRRVVIEGLCVGVLSRQRSQDKSTAS